MILDRRFASTVILLWLAVVLIGAVYQVAVGIELLHIGTVPGEGPPLDSFFFTIPILLLVFGGIALLFTAAVGPAARLLTRPRAFIAVPVVAALFPLCRAVAFDPYYAPGLRRFWDANTNGAWLALLVALAILTSAFAVRRSGNQVSAALTSVVMIASGITAIGEGLH